MVAIVTGSVAWVYINTALNNMDDMTFRMWLPWLFIHIAWFFYMSGNQCGYLNTSLVLTSSEILSRDLLLIRLMS